MQNRNQTQFEAIQRKARRSFILPKLHSTTSTSSSEHLVSYHVDHGSSRLSCFCLSSLPFCPFFGLSSLPFFPFRLFSSCSLLPSRQGNVVFKHSNTARPHLSSICPPITGVNGYSCSVATKTTGDGNKRSKHCWSGSLGPMSHGHSFFLIRHFARQLLTARFGRCSSNKRHGILPGSLGAK
jgi:hypothetical protein